MYEQIQSKREKRTLVTLGIVWGVVLVVIGVILVFVLFFSENLKRSSLKGTVELYYESIEEENIDKYKSFVPEYWKEYLRASYDSVINNQFKRSCSTFNTYEGINLSIKINDINEYDKYGVDNIREKFANWYRAENIEAFAIVDVDIYDNKGNKWNNDELPFIKINGKWYIGYGNI